jgi:hypothetical protein
MNPALDTSAFCDSVEEYAKSDSAIGYEDNKDRIKQTTQTKKIC